MKSEFEARPVFVKREDRIKAHFLTCYISLLVYRLLEKKTDGNFTCMQILETLRTMNMTLLTKDSGYIPSYKRTHVTDALHNDFGFRTDYEFISKASMYTIIKDSKQHKIAHIDAKHQMATMPINTGIAAVLCSSNCQRWDCIMNRIFLQI